MLGAQEGGKGKRGGRDGLKGKGASSASNNSTTDIRPAAASQTVTPVPPPPPGSPRAVASMMLVSTSLTAPTTPVLTSGPAEEVQDLTDSEKGVVTSAEINAGVHTADMARTQVSCACTPAARLSCLCQAG
jgi:hypothetical protein